ncbi:chaplin family protein [Streptomyces hundungensis]|nr:chaplin family protein [Streptomyces hundungensis]
MSANCAQAAGADAESVGSPGVLSGNTISAPVEVPVQACGNSVNPVGALNPSFGNNCATVSSSGERADDDAAYMADHAGEDAGRPGAPSHDYGDFYAREYAAAHAPEHHAGGSQAHSVTSGSPGVVSGNSAAAPVDVPVQACGNSVSVVGLLNPTFGNHCATNPATHEPHRSAPPRHVPPTRHAAPPVHHAAPPVHQVPPAHHAAPPVHQAPPAHHAAPPVHQAPPAHHAAPPAHHVPPVHQAPPMHQAPPTHEVPPAHQAPSVHHAPPVHQAPPMHEAPPTHATPRVHDAPPAHHAHHAHHVPPHHCPPGHEAHHAPPERHLPPVHEAPPVHHAPPVHQAPPVHHAPPVHAAPPVHQAPPVHHAPPVHDTPRHARHAVPARPDARVVAPVASAHLADTGADPALLAAAAAGAAGLVLGGSVLYRRGRAMAKG